MTDKEQRYVLVAIPKTDKEETCPFYSVCDGVDDCSVLGLEYTDCENCHAGISRSNVSYKMAKALCNWYYHECSECALKDKPKECRRFLKDSDFCELAEAELDALLGETK